MNFQILSRSSIGSFGKGVNSSRASECGLSSGASGGAVEVCASSLAPSADVMFSPFVRSIISDGEEESTDGWIALEVSAITAAVAVCSSTAELVETGVLGKVGEVIEFITTDCRKGEGPGRCHFLRRTFFIIPTSCRVRGLPMSSLFKLCQKLSLNRALDRRTYEVGFVSGKVDDADGSEGICTYTESTALAT